MRGRDGVKLAVWGICTVALMRYSKEPLLLKFLRLRRDHEQDLRQSSYHTRRPNHLTVSLSSEAIAPDSEISTFVIVIVKDANAILFLINFAFP
jgi:hypothetical protein